MEVIKTHICIWEALFGKVNIKGSSIATKMLYLSSLIVSEVIVKELHKRALLPIRENI